MRRATACRPEHQAWLAASYALAGKPDLARDCAADLLRRMPEVRPQGSISVETVIGTPRRSATSGGRPAQSGPAGMKVPRAAGFAPKYLDTSVYDEVVKVSNDDSIANARLSRPARRRAGRHLVGRGAPGGNRRRLAPRYAGKLGRDVPSSPSVYLSTVLFEGLAERLRDLPPLARRAIRLALRLVGP